MGIDTYARATTDGEDVERTYMRGGSPSDVMFPECWDFQRRYEKEVGAISDRYIDRYAHPAGWSYGVWDLYHAEVEEWEADNPPWVPIPADVVEDRLEAARGSILDPLTSDNLRCYEEGQEFVKVMREIEAKTEEPALVFVSY